VPAAFCVLVVESSSHSCAQAKSIAKGVLSCGYVIVSTTTAPFPPWLAVWLHAVQVATEMVKPNGTSVAAANCGRFDTPTYVSVTVYVCSVNPGSLPPMLLFCPGQNAGNDVTNVLVAVHELHPHDTHSGIEYETWPEVDPVPSSGTPTTSPVMVFCGGWSASTHCVT